MSVRRAMIRREAMKRIKDEKRKSPMGKLERARNRGVSDGRTIAASVVFQILHDKYSLTNSQIQKLYDFVNKESARLDDIGVKFVAEHYYDMFAERIDRVRVQQEYKSLEEEAYCRSRDNLYISTVAVILMCLNELWDYSSNSKNTGRLDFVMEYCSTRYLEFQLDPKNHTADYYFNKMTRKTGYVIRI